MKKSQLPFPLKFSYRKGMARGLNKDNITSLFISLFASHGNSFTTQSKRTVQPYQDKREEMWKLKKIRNCFCHASVLSLKDAFSL